MTDAQILEVIRELGGATTSGDWIMRFGRVTAERATLASQAAPAGETLARRFAHKAKLPDSPRPT